MSKINWTGIFKQATSSLQTFADNIDVIKDQDSDEDINVNSKIGISIIIMNRKHKYT